MRLLVVAALQSLLACSHEQGPFDSSDILQDSALPPEQQDSAGEESGSYAEDTSVPVELHGLSVGPVVGAIEESRVRVMLRVDEPSTVRVLASTDQELSGDLLYSQERALDRDSYLTGIFELEGLEPDTRYYYGVEQNGARLDLGTTPRFRTAPTSDSLQDFSFGILSDAANGPVSGNTTFQSLAAKEPAFVLQIGDLDHRDPGSTVPVVIENWRAMHRDQLRFLPQGQIFQEEILNRFPLFHTWDDHDYGANNADGSAAWKAMATQAFKEYYPMPDLPNPEAGIWYRFRWAQADFFMLDDRSQRDSALEKADDLSLLAAGDIPDDQKSWLLDGLLESTATWKFIISGSVWNPHSKTTDSWYEFPREQREILDFISDNGISGVVVISGDLHSGGGIDDGSNSGIPEITVPTCNMDETTCTGHDGCGDWSEGIWEGNSPQGFAYVELRYDAVLQQHRAVLLTFSQAGKERLRYIVTP